MEGATLEQAAQFAALCTAALHGVAHEICADKVPFARSWVAWRQIFTETALHFFHDGRSPRLVAERLVVGGWVLGCASLFGARIRRALRGERIGAALDRFLGSGAAEELGRLAHATRWAGSDAESDAAVNLGVTEWWNEAGVRGESAFRAAFEEVEGAAELARDLGPIAGRLESAASGGARMLPLRIKSRAIDERRRESAFDPLDGLDEDGALPEKHRRPPPLGLSADLSPLERDIVRLRLQGLVGKKIADRLGVSATTVSRCEQAIRRKLSSSP